MKAPKVVLPWIIVTMLSVATVLIGALRADQGGRIGQVLMAGVSLVLLAMLTWTLSHPAETDAQAVTGADDVDDSELVELRRVNAELQAELARQADAINEANKQRAILRQVIDNNPQMVFVKDWDGRFTLANRATAEVYGTTTDDLVGRTDADFNSNAQQIADFLQADREVMESGRIKAIPAEPVTDARTGVVRWFDTIKVPLEVGSSGVREVLGISTDITMRREVEEELRRTSDELQGWFAASPLAICSLSPENQVMSWNRAAEELFGWTAEEVLGMELPIVPEDRTDEALALHRQVLAGGEFTGFETERCRKDGTLVAVSISTAALHDASGATSGVAAVYSDISSRKELESQLRQSQRIESIGKLAGGIAHDFNNILTVIQPAAEVLLADLSPDDPHRAEAQAINQAAQRAGDLTRQLLAFSRRQMLELQVLDLSREIEPLQPMLERLVQAPAGIEFRLASDLLLVKADVGQLHQVVMNLVVNARDAMPQGGTILVETSNAFPGDHEVDPATGELALPAVMLSVSDTGVGMDLATQSRVFEPFFTTKPVGEGTGLGLSTVYGIVKQLGGQIRLISEVGKGSTFRVLLPAHAGPRPELCEPQTASKREVPRDGTTVLLVEDDEAVRAVVKRILTRHKYHVLDAGSGAQALELYHSNDGKVDIVLSDMVMPKMTGLELRQRIEELQPGLPVVLMSGFSEEAINRITEHQVVAPLIQKPFAMDALIQMIDSVLSNRPD